MAVYVLAKTVAIFERTKTVAPFPLTGATLVLLWASCSSVQLTGRRQLWGTQYLSHVRVRDESVANLFLTRMASTTAKADGKGRRIEKVVWNSGQAKVPG